MKNVLILAMIAVGVMSSSAFAASGASVSPSAVSTTGGVWDKVTYSSTQEQYDTADYIGTNRFTVPADGIYLLTMKGVFDNTSGSNNDRLNFAYSVNGGSLVGMWATSVDIGHVIHGNASIQVKLNTGDYVEFFVLSFYSGTVDQIILGVSQL